MFLLNDNEYKPLISLILEDMFIFLSFSFDFYMKLKKFFYLINLSFFNIFNNLKLNIKYNYY